VTGPSGTDPGWVDRRLGDGFEDGECLGRGGGWEEGLEGLTGGGLDIGEVGKAGTWIGVAEERRWGRGWRARGWGDETRVGESRDEMRWRGNAFIDLSNLLSLSCYPLSTVHPTFTDGPVKFNRASVVKIVRYTMDLDNRRNVERRRSEILVGGRKPVAQGKSSMNQTWRFHHDDSDR